MLQNINQIEASFKNKTAKIGVIGLGYVGLPLCLKVSKKFKTKLYINSVYFGKK